MRRTDTSGKQIDCNGFMIDMFTVVVSYEKLNNVLTEAKQLAEDYINMEEKELRRLADEYHRFAE